MNRAAYITLQKSHVAQNEEPSRTTQNAPIIFKQTERFIMAKAAQGQLIVYLWRREDFQ